MMGLHSDGPEAHMARHLVLARAGWRQREASVLTLATLLPSTLLVIGQLA